MKWQYLIAGLLIAGCAEPQSEIEAQKAALTEQARELGSAFRATDTESGALSVQLAFESNADLDLYVTGPLLETVYFANHNSKSGGSIDEDVRCDTEGERLEEIRFENPLPGRYRVGVDFPEGCEEGILMAPYAVQVLHNGESQQVFGTVDLQRFEVVVLEFEL